MDDKAEKIALFRYGLIAPLVLETLSRGELTRRAQQIAARLYDIPHSIRRQVSVETLLDWTLRYRRNGIDALCPKPRQDRGQTRSVTPETATLIERLKRENPHRTGAALLRELALANEPKQRGLSASTLYRFLRARGLTERELLLDKATAHKKYEAQFANQIWQSDMLFGPWVARPGGGKQQVFLQATLDDASRLIPHAQFYLNQGLDAFLDCLRQAIAARGIPTRLYMDNAKIYRSPGAPSGPGPHRRLHWHSHRAHASLSARRPRQDRTLLPFRARTVSGFTRSQGPAVHRATQRAPVALARHGLSPP